MTTPNNPDTPLAAGLALAESLCQAGTNEQGERTYCFDGHALEGFLKAVLGQSDIVVPRRAYDMLRAQLLVTKGLGSQEQRDATEQVLANAADVASGLVPPSAHPKPMTTQEALKVVLKDMRTLSPDALEAELQKYRPAPRAGEEPAAEQADDVPGDSTEWQHNNGSLYTVLVVANTHATRVDEYPVTVVYRGADGKVWSRPLSRWHASMSPVAKSAGPRSVAGFAAVEMTEHLTKWGPLMQHAADHYKTCVQCGGFEAIVGWKWRLHQTQQALFAALPGNQASMAAL